MRTPDEVLQQLLTQRIPADYDDAAVLVREVAEQMLARLEWMTIEPKVIVEIGCGVGYLTELITKRYPSATIIAIDSAQAMLDYAKEHHKLATTWQNAPVDQLPYPIHYADLVIANLTLPWCATLDKPFREWRRILRPEGLFLFSSFGPDTLHEIQNAAIPFPHLLDMHNVGDALATAGFTDPVLDVENFTLTYRDKAKMLEELKITGMIENSLDTIDLEPDATGIFSLTYEVVYGHAFGPNAHAGLTADEHGEVHIPISHILRRR